MTKEERLALSQTKEFKQFMKDLAYFSKNYIIEIARELIKNASEIYKEKTIVKLLEKYHINKLKEDEENERNFMYAFEKIYDYEFDRNYCLTNSKSYQDVLYDLLEIRFYNTEN